jgi:hypothetical protein
MGAPVAVIKAARERPPAATRAIAFRVGALVRRTICREAFAADVDMRCIRARFTWATTGRKILLTFAVFFAFLCFGIG